MQLHKHQDTARIQPVDQNGLPRNIIELDSDSLLRMAEVISKECRYPFLGLRLLIHIICGIDGDGKIQISARHLAKKLGAHYDTTTKCLKFLRHIGVIQTRR